MDSTTDWDLFSSYAGLLILASGSIYAGAFGSLPVCPSLFFLCYFLTWINLEFETLRQR